MEKNKSLHTVNSWLFLAVWVFLQAIAFLGFFWLLTSGLDNFINNENFLGYLIAGGTFGVLLGGAQWLVARWLLKLQLSLPFWFFLSVIGGGFGFAVASEGFDALAQVLGEYATNAFAWSALLLWISTAQWFVLHRHLKRAWLWMLANGVGAIILVWLTNLIPNPSSVDYGILVFGGLGQFLITGIMLLWLVQNSQSEREKEKAKNSQAIGLEATTSNAEKLEEYPTKHERLVR